MTDDSADTERMRLLRLVHDAESWKYLAAQAPNAVPEDANDDGFDLSGLKADRFPSRVPVTATTDGHRTAAYATNAEPAPRALTSPCAPRIEKVLVDAQASETSAAPTSFLLAEPPAPLASGTPLSKEARPHGPSREASTVRRRHVRQGPNETAADERAFDRRERTRRVVAAALGAVGLIAGVGVARMATHDAGASSFSTHAAMPKAPAPAPVEEAPSASRANPRNEGRTDATSPTSLPTCVAPRASAAMARRPATVGTTPRSPLYDRSFE